MQTIKPSLDALQAAAVKSALVRTFLDLVSVNTQADENVPESPSCPGQLTLGQQIAARIKSTGADLPEIFTTEQGVVAASFSASPGCERAYHLALLSHLDTAPDCSGENVKPHLVKAYPGGPIELPNGLILDETVCPELKHHLGDDIITTDGTTLLGADDKAGCAVLLELIDAVQAGLPHGPLTFVFTVDEEIGRSAGLVPLERINADFGVTIDGCELGELDTATFNAGACTVTIHGRSIHTGSAYGKMVNALKLAAQFIQELPADEAPETTQGLQGFYHIYSVSGGVEQAQVRMILRDFEMEGLKKREDFIRRLCWRLGERFVPQFKAQYRNLAAVLQEHPLILDLCRQAYAQAGVPVREQSVRGGTDGSELSYRGLPCPNIFTGALNCHGPYECLPVQALQQSFNCARSLIQLTAQTVKPQPKA